MGSVRRAGFWGFLPYLGLNVLVSAITIIAILLLWDCRGSQVSGTPTATLDALARASTLVPTATDTPVPSPTPPTYTVKSGDTLYGIARKLGVSLEELLAANPFADADTLKPGQVLIVPEGGRLPQRPTATPQPDGGAATSTPVGEGGPPDVQIRGIDEPGNLEAEAVQLLNVGGAAHMAGWTLDDGEGRLYVFPAFTLHRGAISVHTRDGTDTVIDLYWGLSEAIWAPGKVVTLRDTSGTVQSTFQIPPG